MKVFLLAAGVGIGVLAALHLAMNAQVGVILGSVRAANVLFWVIGALTAVCTWAVAGDHAALARAGSVPIELWLAGAIGTAIVLGISTLMPRLGVGPTTVALLLGQVAAAAIISHCGWLGGPVVPLDAGRVAGLVLMGVGVWLSTR